MPSRDSYKSVMIFIVKIVFLVSGYYYFSEQINAYADKQDLRNAAIYSGAYAGMVLVLLLLFRWSHLLARVLAGILGFIAYSSVLALYILNKGTDYTAFIATYSGILLLTVIVGYAILYKKSS